MTGREYIYNSICKSSFPSVRRVSVKNRLEEIRKSHGIKQEELVAALEVSRQTISFQENGCMCRW